MVERLPSKHKTLVQSLVLQKRKKESVIFKFSLCFGNHNSLKTGSHMSSGLISVPHTHFSSEPPEGKDTISGM
jgi:hypothetical protein